jgi:hypothetical protein
LSEILVLKNAEQDRNSEMCRSNQSFTAGHTVITHLVVEVWAEKRSIISFLSKEFRPNFHLSNTDENVQLRALLWKPMFF